MTEASAPDSRGSADPSSPSPLAIYPPAGGPHTDRLVEATRRFQVGDFRSAGRIAREVLASTEATSEERAFSREVLGRIRMDPLALVLGLLCLVLFVGVVWSTLLR